jgi:DNA-binding FadR family transcriptional regulator
VREADDRPLVRDFATLFRLGRVSRAQLIEARRLIEPEVAFLAAQRAGETDIKELTAAVDQRDTEAASGGEPRRFDLVFHRLLANAARNPVHAVVTHALMALEAEVIAPHVRMERGGQRRGQRGTPADRGGGGRPQGRRGPRDHGRPHRRGAGEPGPERRLRVDSGAG